MTDTEFWMPGEPQLFQTGFMGYLFHREPENIDSDASGLESISYGMYIISKLVACSAVAKKSTLGLLVPSLTSNIMNTD